MKLSALELRDIPVGWLCPRCGKVNAPDVRQCSCKSKDVPVVIGPSETKETEHGT